MRLRPETVLAIAGITNTFTAAEVMHLVATGQVKLDDPMSAYVKHPLAANGATVRETLSMRSGLSDPAEGTFDKPFLAQPHRHWTMTETLSYTPKSSRAPGGMSEYADTNFLLLGLLIEAVSHKSAAAALRADLIDPAGLTRTAVQDTERPVPPVAVPKHDEVPATFDGYVPLHSAVSALVTAGGIAADAADVARWGYSLYGGLLLEPSLVAQMTQPLATQPNTPYTAYGLGTMQFSEALGPDSLGHTGQAPGFSSLLVVVPERREAVAVLIADSNTGPFSVARKLVAALGT
jgi:D-alanyl-D-alanine carboxypeptidase